MWRVDEAVQPDGTVHVWPDADMFEHDISAGSACACGPWLEEQSNGKVLVTHHSLDGREAREV